MTRIARHSIPLPYPPEALLTPRTFDQVIQIPPPRELLAQLLVLGPKVKMRVNPLSSLRRHIEHFLLC
jgi:hypothetical protein